MRIQIEPTDKIMTFDGVECRLWNGVTDTGVHCFLLVHRIGVHQDENLSTFKEALNEMHHPSIAVVVGNRSDDEPLYSDDAEPKGETP